MFRWDQVGSVALLRSLLAPLHYQQGGDYQYHHHQHHKHPSTSINMVARFPDPLAFGSGSGLQCVYTVVISLWGTPAAKFVLESLKTLFYWIPLCIRKPQAVFQKFSSTHVSPSDRFISSPRSPLSSSPHLPLLMCVFLRTRPFKFPISFQQHLKRALWLIIGTFLMGSRSISEGF